jgi:multidrug transporter EmrE-like cation transporter
MMSFREALMSWGMVAAYVLLNSFGALAIKHEVHRIGAADATSVTSVVRFFTATLLSPPVLVALFAIGLSACAWIIALSRMQLSTAYPVAVALNCLIVVSTGFTVYGEPLGYGKLAALGLLFTSLALLFRS